jgi:hypothetical protein
VASALGLYPIDVRTSTFALPFFVLLFVLAPAGLLSDQRLGRARDALGLVLAIVVCVIGARWEGYTWAPGNDDRALVERLVASAGASDGILIYPHANWTVGYYGTWPVELRPTENYGTRFEAVVQRPRTLNLPGTRGYEDRPELLDPSLAPFIAQRYSRILYIAAHLEYKGHTPHTHIQRRLLEAGYRMALVAATPNAQLLEFRLPARGDPNRPL